MNDVIHKKTTRINVELALTTYCQARCRSCSRTNEQTGEKESWLKLDHMTFEQYQRVIDQDLPFGNIIFCGEFGDPLMHPNLAEFIDYGLQKHPTATMCINTNGGLRNPDWFKRLYDKHKDRIQIKWGIDGTDHDTNWMYREGVDFQRAWNNMTSWLGDHSWHFIIFSWNWHQIPKAVDLSIEHSIPLHFKINDRQWGLISNEDKQYAIKLIREGYDKINKNRKS